MKNATKQTTKSATTKATAKPATKPTTKARKSNLTDEQRHAIYRLAALRAHTHKTFQSERNRDERTAQTKAYAAELRKFNKKYPKLARVA